MRLDKFLQISGLLKRRVIANEACKRGLVKINGLQAKPTREIRTGDIVEIELPHRRMVARILTIPTIPSIPKARRDEFFEILENIVKSPIDDWD